MIKINKIQVENMANILSTFLDEIKQLFNQLLQQNSAVLNLVAVDFTIDIIRRLRVLESMYQSQTLRRTTLQFVYSGGDM